MGKVIGTISGEFLLCRIPLLQQMNLGVLTENGIVMNFAPIMVEEKEQLFMGIVKRAHRNEKITMLMELTKKLKKVDNLKANNKYSYNDDKDRILNDIIMILAQADKSTNS